MSHSDKVKILISIMIILPGLLIMARIIYIDYLENNKK